LVDQIIYFIVLSDRLLVGAVAGQNFDAAASTHQSGGG